MENDILRPPTDNDRALDATELAPVTVHGAQTRYATDSETGQVVGQSQRNLASARFEERFKLETVLGEGGMGEVLAYGDQNIGRDVAVKRILSARKDSEVTLRRFLREGCIQGQLEHPTIVPVYDLRLDAADQPALIMKRVRGKTLEELLRERSVEGDPGKDRLSTRRLLDLFLRACEGVTYAHARGVVHRDLKPSNLMVGRFGEVYVLDWGIAKLIGGGDDTLEVDLAATGEHGADRGVVVGTLAYMSPEQFRGEEIDARTDVFALGAILFEILAGEPLRTGRTAQELSVSIANPDERRPSQRQKDAFIPPELDELVARATTANRDERLPSAAEFVRWLERFLAGEKSIELRRGAAKQYLEEASSLLASGEKNLSLSHRELALHHIGKALALDPNADAAITLLNDCLAIPMTEVPPEVNVTLEANTLRRSRSASVAARFAYMQWIAYLPLFLMMGVRDWTALGLSLFLFVVASALSWANVSKSSNAILPTLAFISCMLGLAIVSSLFGSLFFVPTIAIGALVSFSINHQRTHILIALSAASLVMLFFPVAEWFGWLPTNIVFENGSIRIVPRLVSFDKPVWVFLFLLIANLGVVATFMAYVHWIKIRLRQDQYAQAMQSWHLKKIFPIISESTLTARTMKHPSPTAGASKAATR